MEIEKKIKVLQGMYAGALADSVLRMGKEGVLDKITEEKRIEQMQNGKINSAQMGITKPEEVFEVLSDVFGCANWKITNLDYGFTAEATGCMLCSICKRMVGFKPCNIYCLNPMEAMVKGVNNDSTFTIHETLWEGKACKIEVKFPE